MSLITVPGGGYWPPLRYHTEALAAPSGTSLNAAAKKLAYLIHAPRQGILDQFEIRTASTSLIAVGSSIKFSFQNVNTGADPCEPDGSIDQFRNVSGAVAVGNSWIAPGLITSDGTDTGTKRNVNRNELLALCLEFQTFTAADAFDLAYATIRATVPDGRAFRHFPAEMFYDGSAWSRVTANAPLILALKYSDGIYARISPENPPIKTGLSTAFNNGSATDEIGARLRRPYPTRVDGAWILSNLVVSAGAFDVVLYDEDGTTELTVASIDTDQALATGAEVLLIPFSTEFELAKDTYYRLAIRPSTGTSTRYRGIAVESEAHMAALPGGADWHRTSRVDAGAWTETPTEHPLMGLHSTAVEELDSSGGGGGGGFVAVSRGFKRGMV